MLCCSIRSLVRNSDDTIRSGTGGRTTEEFAIGVDSLTRSGEKIAPFRDGGIEPLLRLGRVRHEQRNARDGSSADPLLGGESSRAVPSRPEDEVWLGGG